MSTEQPGKSSAREGMRLNTGFSLEEYTDPLPKESFFLGVKMGGRMVRPDKFPPLLLCAEASNPSFRQYNRCVRCPWLVSLKWYWHDPGLKRHSKDSKKVNHGKQCQYFESNTTISLSIWHKSDLFHSTWGMCQDQAWEQKVCHWQSCCQCLWQTEGQCVFDHVGCTLPACLQSEAYPSGLPLPWAPAGSLEAPPPHWAQHAKRTFYRSVDKETKSELLYGLILKSSSALYSRNPGIVTVTAAGYITET